MTRYMPMLCHIQIYIYIICIIYAIYSYAFLILRFEATIHTFLCLWMLCCSNNMCFITQGKRKTTTNKIPNMNKKWKRYRKSSALVKVKEKITNENKKNRKWKISAVCIYYIYVMYANLKKRAKMKRNREQT